MGDIETAELPFAGYERELARELRRGIRAELDASTDDEELELVGGRLVGVLGGRQYWSFAGPIDPATTPAAETPAQLRTVDADVLHATVVAVGDESVTVALDEAPAGNLESASLRLDVSFLLHKLAGRISELEASGAEMLLIDELLSPEQRGESTGGPAGDELEAISATADQERAARLAVEPGVRFTWGPPGTGKTRVLGQAVGIAARRGDHVLVVAHANGAVDVAAARIAAELAGDDLLTSGSVLRVGSPLPGSAGLHDVLPDVVADDRSPERVDRRDGLRAERSWLSDQLRTRDEPERAALTGRLQEVRRELVELERADREAVGELVESATVIVTTVARAVIDDAIWARDWDVVMVDEVSMAPLPMVLALAMRGPATLSALGDPRQLPPIHRSEDPDGRHWFGRDLFAYAGFDEPGHDPWRDPRISTLRVQFRMGEAICAAVDAFAYDGMLRTDSSARNVGIRLAEASPCPTAELVVVDSAGIGARCWADPSPGSFSRINPTTGLLAASIGAELLDTGCKSVALVSPYRAQVRWLTALAARSDGMVASTVHRMQGSEADAIVLDMTDAPPHAKPSRLTGEDSELATRLLNVAASRARGKLVVVTDLEFVEQRIALGGPIRRFLDAMDSAGADHVSAPDLISSWTAKSYGAVRWYGDWSTASDALPAEGRSSGPAGVQPWLVAGDSVMVGPAGGDGPVAIVRDLRAVDGFLGGVAGIGRP